MSPKLVYYTIQLLEGFGMGAFFPIYTPWLELHGLNFFKMGSVNFFYHIMTSALDPFTGFIADKFGKRKSFIVGQIFWTTTQFIYGASSQISGFLLAEGMAAIGNSLKSDALESWLQNRLGKAESSKVRGKAKTLFISGQITTSILAGYISTNFGMQTAWFIAGTFFLIATVLGSIALIMAGQDIPDKNIDTPNLSLKKIVKVTIANKKIVTVALLVATYSFATKPLFMYWPQIVAGLNMPEQIRGWTILAISLPVMCGSLLAGHNRFFTGDQIGLVKIFVILCFGLLTTAVANSLIIFFIGLIIVELAFGSIRIAVDGFLYEEIDDKHRSTVNSLISATTTLGGAISLLAMGALADLFSPQVSIGIGGILILGVILLYIRYKK